MKEIAVLVPPLSLWFPRGSFIYYVRKIFRKTSFSYPLMGACTRTYQGVRNVSFSGTFAYVLNEGSQGMTIEKVAT